MGASSLHVFAYSVSKRDVKFGPRGPAFGQNSGFAGLLPRPGGCCRRLEKERHGVNYRLGVSLRVALKGTGRA